MSYHMILLKKKKLLKKRLSKYSLNRNYYDKLIILRPNLIFGTKSYIVRFLTQHWIENFTYFNNIEFYKHYRFNPLYIYFNLDIPMI